jgi:RNA polymerase sigma-70 factor (ECF subfamily)
VFSAIEACIPALRRYAAALLRGRQDADDLVHDTLLRALDNLHTRRDDGDLRAWLFAIMHNLFISQARRAGMRREREPQAVTIEPDAGQPGGQEEALYRRDLVRALNALPPEHRAVILLVAVEDLSYAEAARILNIPIGTVMSRLSRAREKLRQVVDSSAAGDAPGHTETRSRLRRVK